jgi:hypothetical protein
MQTGSAIVIGAGFAEVTGYRVVTLNNHAALLQISGSLDTMTDTTSAKATKLKLQIKDDLEGLL